MIRLLARPAATLLILTIALPAFAAPGLHLNWDHCIADGRVANKAFACDTNAGSHLLVFSYELPVAMPDFAGVEMTIHIKSSNGTMPEWWKFSPAGACRVAAMTFDISPAVAGTCETPYAGVGGGGIASFTPDLVGPGSWRVLAVAAVPIQYSVPLEPGLEYFAFALVLRNLRTVGSGACAGCATPMCIGFGHARVVSISGNTTIDILAGGPNLGGGDVAVGWQGAYVRNYTTFLDLTHLNSTLTCDSDSSVPTRGSTWAAVKALYR